MINTLAPELNPPNRRGLRSAYLCLKVDEKENKFSLGNTMLGDNSYNYSELILTCYSTNSRISLYCDSYIYSQSNNGSTSWDCRSGATQLNEQGTTYHYVIFG